MRATIEATEKRVPVIAGVGWMAGPACIVPKQSVKLHEMCRAEKWHEAMVLQRDSRQA